jgi:hypothetical protein
VRVFVFVISFVIFLASLYLFSLAFSVVGWEALLFVAGIIGVSISFAIPVHLLKRLQP